MNSDWKGLAARIRSTIEAKEQAKEREAELARRRAEEERELRMALLDELVAFGEAVGHFEVRRDPNQTALGYEGRALVFRNNDAAGVVEVDYPDARAHGARVACDRRFGDRWMLSLVVDGQARWYPLLEVGLELLCARALMLTVPPPQVMPQAALFTRTEGGSHEKLLILNDTDEE